MGYGQYSDSSRGKRNPFNYESGKPKREVFPTDEIAHKWAHQAQARARNAQGNLFFEGATIYSYRRSWPLARIYTKGDKRYANEALAIGDNYENNSPSEAGVLVLTNSDKYSVTTAKQQSDVRRAASHLPQIAVPVVVPGNGERLTAEEHAQNLAHLTELAAACLARAQRAMSHPSLVHDRETALGAVQDAARYIEFFGIRRKAPVFPESDWLAAHERVQRIVSPDPTRDAARYRAKQKRQTAARAALQAEFAAYSARVNAYNEARRTAYANLPDAAQQWRETGTWPKRPDIDAPAPYLDYKLERKFRDAGFDVPRIDYYGERSRDVLLRVDGEDIVTSMGARVPLAAAPMVWNMVQRAMRAGGFSRTVDTDARNAVRYGGTLRIGDYPLDRIDEDGTLHAGCHTIKYAELELLARRLGLTDTEERQT